MLSSSLHPCLLAPGPHQPRAQHVRPWGRPRGVARGPACLLSRRLRLVCEAAVCFLGPWCLHTRGALHEAVLQISVGCPGRVQEAQEHGEEEDLAPLTELC